MSSAKAKLSDLKSAKKKLGIYNDRTSEIRNCVSQLMEAFEEYVRTDHMDSGAIFGELKLQIEEHADFTTAVSHLNAAIQAAEEEVRREEEAKKAQWEAFWEGVF